MSFVSPEFLVFFALVVPLYFLIPYRWRWLYLLVTSAVFYAYWNAGFIWILFGSLLADFYIARAISRADNPRVKKRYLALALSLNLSILFFFKYFNFFNASVYDLLGALNIPYNPQSLNLILPIGISFYTFEEMAYTFDVYRGKIMPEERLGVFATFILFFPKLVAGPIERPAHLIPQFYWRENFDYDRIVEGLRLILWGFFKKVVIADRLAIYVNAVYGQPEQYNGPVLALATLFFAFQIYCDFSGYSDIALGTARIMGFKLLENFRQPYLSQSVTEFWRRWHISLSTWFRDYLYIPLGGSRVSLPRNLLNLMIVFLVSGLWHGASWTFVIWGALHGLYVALEALLRLKPVLPANISDSFGGRLLKTLLTFILVTVAWIFFRARSVADAVYILGHLFTVTPESLRGLSVPFNALADSRLELGISMALIVLLMVVDILDNRWGLNTVLGRSPTLVRWGVYYSTAVAVLLSLILASGTQNFIYFQF